MTLDDATVWLVIVAMGFGSLTLRYSFLGLIGRRELPEWLLRPLRYTPVAVIPGLVAPQVFRVAEGSTGPDPVVLTVAAATLGVGVWRKNPIWAMLAGGATLTLLTILGL
jgi:branched-subunit amino acid transport protein